MFSFKAHKIDMDLPPGLYAQTALADINNDGKLEYILGLQWGDIYYYTYESPDQWHRHLLGKDSPSDVGAVVLDVDGDGWLDFVTGGAWYRNPRKDGEAFERIVFDPDLAKVHDVLAADIDGDGRDEIIVMSDASDLRWYKIPENPRQRWQYTVIGGAVHSGAAAGDIAGKGYVDIVRTNAWFENVKGDGSLWTEHPLPFPPQAMERITRPFMVNATHASVCDVNKDGKNDIIMLENEMPSGKLFWLENVRGDGSEWRRHDIYVPCSPLRGACHSLITGDMDGDGDIDIMTCEMDSIRGDETPKYYIWENVDGIGGRWKEHVILDGNLGGHATVMGDVTGNGKPDFLSKPWKPSKDNALGGRSYLLFLENLD